MMNNELVILNLRECNIDELPQAVIHTFNAIGFKDKIDIESLYRRGPPRHDADAAPRPVIVRLHRSDVAEKIIKMAKNKGQSQNRKAIRILPNLPEQVRQQRNKLGTIAHRTYLKDSKANIKVKSDHVLVNNQKIRDEVLPTTPNEVLFMDQKERASVQVFEFITTRQIGKKQSYFQLYYCFASTKNQCKLAYKAISSIPAVACKTHLISAYTLTSNEFGWQDDHDHGLGKCLLRAMEEREMSNAICFVTREYGGIHIGKHRYDIIQALVDEVLINIEAQPNSKGARPYRVHPPAMALPHPSAQQVWTTTRPTLQAHRRAGNTTNTDATDGDPDIQENDEQGGEQSFETADDSDKQLLDMDMDTTITPGKQNQPPIVSDAQIKAQGLAVPTGPIGPLPGNQPHPQPTPIAAAVSVPADPPAPQVQPNAAPAQPEPPGVNHSDGLVPSSDTRDDNAKD
jgi:hypothetical protein